ncbi:MAG: hypothetical protein ACREAU_01225 [Nitrosopumilaceae archaeon]
MKVQEIFSHIHLNLIESYSTKLPLKWLNTPTGKGATFEIGEEKYYIEINVYNMPLVTRQKPLEVYEVSFKRMLVIPTVVQTPSKHFSQVFGVVYNGILEVIHKDQPDIVFFSAKFKNDKGDTEIFDKRVRIYSQLASRAAMHGIYNKLQEPLRSKHALNFVLIQHEINITKDEIEWIKEHI